jgi:hypothetical protein
MRVLLNAANAVYAAYTENAVNAIGHGGDGVLGAVNVYGGLPPEVWVFKGSVLFS